MTDPFRAAKKIVIKTKHARKIQCPYCRIGWAIFKFTITNFGEIQGNAGDPLKCLNTDCKKWFKVKPQVVLTGVRMEDGKSLVDDAGKNVAEEVSKWQQTKTLMEGPVKSG